MTNMCVYNYEGWMYTILHSIPVKRIVVLLTILQFTGNLTIIVIKQSSTEKKFIIYKILTILVYLECFISLCHVMLECIRVRQA